MIAITYALPSESQPLLGKFRHRGEAGAPHLSLGNLGLHETLLIHTGIGPAQTRERLLSALAGAQSPPSLLVSSGYAGALVPGLEAGTLFLAENATSPQLFEYARDFLTARGYPLETGVLHSTSDLVEMPETKAELAASTGAQAVDMETDVIAAVCKERGIPMLSLRVISDNATDPIPVPFKVCINLETGQPRVGAIARHLALHPWRIPGFLQFAKQATRSGRELAGAIASLLPQIQPL